MLEYVVRCHYNPQPAKQVNQVSAAVFLKYVGWQLLIALGLCLVGFGIGGQNSALSSALGSLIAILPNAYFTLQAFRYEPSEDPVKMLGAFYRGEAGKFVLVAVFCVLTFKFIGVHSPLLLFISLIVMLVTQPLISVLALPHVRDGVGAKEN